MPQCRRRTLLPLLFLLVALVVTAPTARAASTIVLPRAGQVGVGISGSFATLLPSGSLGEEFGSGPGLSVRLRYRMRFERAIGLTFDAQQLDSRNPSGAAGAFDSLTDAPAVLRDRLKLVTAGFEFYQMFDTRERTVKMLSAGAGLAQVSAHLTDGEIQYPIDGDGLYLSAGAGIERFFFRSWAWDLNTHYMAVFQGQKINHDISIQLGLIFYAAY